MNISMLFLGLFLVVWIVNIIPRTSFGRKFEKFNIRFIQSIVLLFAIPVLWGLSKNNPYTTSNFNIFTHNYLPKLIIAYVVLNFAYYFLKFIRKN